MRVAFVSLIPFLLEESKESVGPRSIKCGPDHQDTAIILQSFDLYSTQVFDMGKKEQPDLWVVNFPPCNSIKLFFDLAELQVDQDAIYVVHCPHDVSQKADVLLRTNFAGAARIKSECGGVLRMKQILDDFRESGSVSCTKYW